MIQTCANCGRVYDDEHQWTLCPHGPLWAALEAYCREHDMVNCTFEHGTRPTHFWKSDSDAVGKALTEKPKPSKPVALSPTFWKTGMPIVLSLLLVAVIVGYWFFHLKK